MPSRPQEAANNNDFIPLGIIDSNGNPYFRGARSTPASTPATGDGGGGAAKLTLPDLRWNVALLNACAVLYLGALVGMFLWMLDRIDNRFEKASEKVEQVSDQVGDLRVLIAQQGADLRTLLERTNRQPDRSASLETNPATQRPQRTGQ